MPSERVRQWAPTGVLAVGCGLLLLSTRQQAVPLVQPLSTLPTTLIGFTGKDIEVPADQRAIAGMSSYILRLFDEPGGRGRAFSVYVGYYESQNQGKTIHSPKNCLPGGGWEPISAGMTTVAVGASRASVNRYLLGKDSHTALVYYWYQGRGQIASDEYLVKWNLLRDKALSGRSDEALVRIVIPFSGSAAPADSLASAIAVELIPQVDSKLPPYPGRTLIQR